MLGGIADGRTDVTGFLASADCLADARSLPRDGRGGGPAQRNLADGAWPRPAWPGCRRTACWTWAMPAPRSVCRWACSRASASNRRLTGDASLRSRPMERVAKPLRLMGADILTVDGKPPVTVRPVSRLAGIDYALPMASAQVKSSILLAGLYAEGHTTVTEPAPTRDHTERMLRGFGVQVDTSGPRVRLAGGRSSPARASKCRAIFPPRPSSWWPAPWPGADGFVVENVGINPTRTGVLDILKLMGADLRIHARAVAGCRAGGGHRGARLRRCKGIAVPEELVPLAIDELPVLFIAAAAAHGRDRVHRRRRAAREGERPPGRDGRGPDPHRRAQRTGAGWHPHPGWPPAARRARSTATATIASPWPSPWPACSPMARSPSAMWRTWAPRSRASSKPRAAADWTWRSRMSAVPVLTIDGPSRLRQGHRQPARRRPAGLAPAGQRRAVPAGGAGRRARRPRCRPTRPRMPRLAPRLVVHFGQDPAGGERILLGAVATGRHRAPSAPRRPGRAHPGLRPGPRSARPCCSASATSPSPRPGGRRTRHGHRGFPRRRSSRSS